MGRDGDCYVVDIETVGVDWDGLDDSTRDYLLKRAKSDGEREAVPHRLGLDPGTGRVLVIGMLNVSNGRGGVLVQGPPGEWRDAGPSGWQRFDGSEGAILAEFWRVLGKNARRVVTYNGRQFDGPYLMIRSALHGIAPTMNLAGHRYDTLPHCDLAEILTFRGVLRGGFSLDYWCRRFGITSPKDEGLDGSRVQEYYEAGRLQEIVDYCIRDVAATARLFQRLEETLLPLFENGGGGRRG